MQAIAYVGWLRPCYASDALAASPDFKEDLVHYADFSEYQIPEKILEKKFTRLCARYLVKWKYLRRRN
jgi:hypothetical protein